MRIGPCFRPLCAVCRRGSGHVGRVGPLSPLNLGVTLERMLLQGPSTKLLSTSAMIRSPSISPWLVVHSAELFLLGAHSLTGLPWWAVIVGSTITLRCLITLPLAITQNKLIAKIELLQPTIEEYKEAIRHNVVVKCRREGLKDVDEVNRRIYIQSLKMVKDTYVQERCQPWKASILPWTQIPLWIVLSFAVRSLVGSYPGVQSSAALISQFASEGILWFSDLTVPDCWSILPVVLAVTNMVNIELHCFKKMKPTRRQRIITRLFRVLSVAMGVVATQLPAAVTLYWATSSSFGLLQNIAFKIPRVRRTLGIPKSRLESKTPFKDIANGISDRASDFLARQRGG